MTKNMDAEKGRVIMTSSNTPTGIGTIGDTTLETFGLPAGAKIHPDGKAQIAVSSMVSIALADFNFQENANTPGRLLQQSKPINRPANAGFFVVLQAYQSSFTTSDFQHLTERPLGEFSVRLGLTGNNFVCQVRLTDSNQDDPIVIRVSGAVVFFQ